jgi:hypothetical protein
MAERKVTVLNPAGYQEQLPDADNLLLAALPTALNHAVNKQYVDAGLANIDLSDIEADINQLEQDINAIDVRLTTVEGKVSTIEADYATKTYVDQQDQLLSNQIGQEVIDREAGDQNLQDQIDAIIAQGELQNLQEVTDQGSTTTNDMTSTGTITASVLVGDIDQGEY